MSTLGELFDQIAWQIWSDPSLRNAKVVIGADQELEWSGRLYGVRAGDEETKIVLTLERKR